MSEFGEEFIDDWIILKYADVCDHIFPVPEKSLLKKYDKMLKTYYVFKENEARFGLKDLSINGRDLILLGLSGRKIGTTLNTLLNDVIDEVIPNEHSILIDRAIEIIDKDIEKD